MYSVWADDETLVPLDISQAQPFRHRVWPYH
jgi:hypothetical protein